VPFNRRLVLSELKVTAADETFRLEAFSANSGAGRLEGTGEVRLDTTPAKARSDAELWDAWRLDGEGKLELRGFPVVRESVPFALLDARIELSGSAGPDTASMEVVVHEAQAALSDLELPGARAVPRNAHVRYRDWAGDTQLPDNIFAGE
jgi:hypothetical protein